MERQPPRLLTRRRFLQASAAAAGVAALGALAAPHVGELFNSSESESTPEYRPFDLAELAAESTVLLVAATSADELDALTAQLPTLQEAGYRKLGILSYKSDHDPVPEFDQLNQTGDAAPLIELLDNPLRDVDAGVPAAYDHLLQTAHDIELTVVPARNFLHRGEYHEVDERMLQDQLAPAEAESSEKLLIVGHVWDSAPYRQTILNYHEPPVPNVSVYLISRDNNPNSTAVMQAANHLHPSESALTTNPDFMGDFDYLGLIGAESK